MNAKIMAQLAMLGLVVILAISGPHKKTNHVKPRISMLHQPGYDGPSIGNLRGKWILP